MRPILARAFAQLLMTLCAAPCNGQGGRSRGAGDLVPPAPPRAAFEDRSLAPPGGGLFREEDLESWTFWWEFCKDEYLWSRRARRVGDAGPVAAADSGDAVVDTIPVLVHAMADHEQRHLAAACLLALAKLRRLRPEFDLRPHAVPRLKSTSQVVRELAALALGLAGHRDDDTIGLLLDLVRGPVPAAEDSRSFRAGAYACYGLGLLGSGDLEPASRRRIVDALRAELAAERPRSRDLVTAAALALGMLDPLAGPADVLADARRSLDDFATRELPYAWELAQCHATTAAAMLLSRASGSTDNEAIVAAWRRSVGERVADRDERTRWRTVYGAQSSVIALGLVTPSIASTDAADAAIGKVLLQAWRAHRDPQTRRFAIVALGRIGGAWCREQIVREWQTADPRLERPWIALAAGVLGARGEDVLHDELLAEVRDRTSNPSVRAATAVAIGLLDHREDAAVLREILAKRPRSSELAGSLAICLSLLGDQESLPLLRELDVRTASPELRSQLYVARGVLGDRSLCEGVPAILEVETSLRVVASAAIALQLAGDRRALGALQSVVADKELPDWTRAQAAAAIGMLAAPRPAPWNRIASSISYRAMVETLGDTWLGLFDLL